jgi:hypothetical protein
VELVRLVIMAKPRGGGGSETRTTQLMGPSKLTTCEASKDA